MANYLTTDTELTSIANAIRTKGGTQAQLTFPAGFVSAINAISTGGSSSPEVAATTYANNSGTKYSFSLNNMGAYQSSSSNDFNAVVATGYGMVADFNGYVIWKGALMSLNYEDMGAFRYAFTGGGVLIQAYEYTEYIPGEPDPETGEPGTDMEETVYGIQIDTYPYAYTVYISTVAF